MSNPQAELIIAIVSYVTERGGYVTKTKLLKLLYLFDLEFYRAHGKTFTGFHWKYFHLGPWTREFDPLLEGLVSKGSITEQLVEKPDFDAKFLRATETGNLKNAFGDYKDELVFRNLLDQWGRVRQVRFWITCIFELSRWSMEFWFGGRIGNSALSNRALR